MGLPLPLREPWAITEGGLELILAVASRGQMFPEAVEKALQARDGKPLQNTHAVDVREGVAVIPVSGPLFRHADLFTAISGATSYETLRKDLQACVDNPDVRAILLSVDSPGGEVHGCSELSAAIYTARGIKPITAYVGGNMCSAAYWIGSAADDIVAAPSAILGSIGVRTLLVDDSKREEMAGIKSYDIVSSQSPYKVTDPADESARARVQATMTALAGVFVADVARNRGVTADKVMKSYGRGDVLVGQDAVDAGLADRVGDFETVLAALSARRRPNSIGALAMDYSEEECEECMESRKEASAALGLDAKATGAQMAARATALVQFEQQVLAATGGTSPAEALGKIASGVQALGELPTARAELDKVRADGVRRDLRAALESGLAGKRLALGAIQKAIPLVLRGEQKSAWVAAMGGLEAVTKDAVLDAACSVAITADDLVAIGEFVKSSPPIAAEVFEEPPRDSERESAGLDAVAQTIKAAADAARATLDRGAMPPVK